MTTPVEVRVFPPDNTGTGVLLARREQIQASEENNGVGAGRFAMHLDDAQLASNPEILDAFSIVKVKATGAADWLTAWQVEDIVPVQVSAQEKAGRKVTVSGRQVRSLLDSGRVLGDGDQRPFDFSAVSGPWLVSSDWAVPNGVRQDSDTTARADSPAGWPDPAAEWLWASDPELTAPMGYNWFRASFTLAAETDVKVWAAFDNVGDLRINGQSLIQTDWREQYQWRLMPTATLTLPAGTHIVAAKVYNSAQTTGNPGGFLCVVGTADAQGDLDTVIRRTDTSNWLVHDTTGVGSGGVPGWHAAQILITLLTEAQAAGELNPAITWDFDDDLDSNGDPWTDRQDVQIPVGEDLLTTSDRWAGTVYDIHMTPDLVLQAFLRRGSDLTAVPVELDMLTSASGSSRPGSVRNVLRFLWDGVWHEVVDSASVTAYERRPVPLSLGGSGTLEQAYQDANAALADLAWPQDTISVALTSAAGAQPGADFDNGDTVTAPALLSGTTDARVMAWGLAEAENRIDWTVDLYPEV